ncbi:MAG: hypothetical protein PHR47_01110 [Candidatus Pacebacteria bacterium]|nr:hypothetical protein [Candidatus Paceibacterota bacterium]
MKYHNLDSFDFGCFMVLLVIKVHASLIKTGRKDSPSDQLLLKLPQAGFCFSQTKAFESLRLKSKKRPILWVILFDAELVGRDWNIFKILSIKKEKLYKTIAVYFSMFSGFFRVFLQQF